MLAVRAGCSAVGSVCRICSRVRAPAIGIPVPDSSALARARELIADVAEPFLVNHSVRSYAWAVELAQHDRLKFDAEILYVSALLHDIGLVPAYDLGGSFEIDSAIAAKRLMRDAREPDERAGAVYDVIALHKDEAMAPDAASEVVLSGTRPASTLPATATLTVSSGGHRAGHSRAYPHLGRKRLAEELPRHRTRRHVPCRTR